MNAKIKKLQEALKEFQVNPQENSGWDFDHTFLCEIDTKAEEMNDDDTVIGVDTEMLNDAFKAIMNM